MVELDFISALHKTTQRDYLARVNDPIYPKAKAANLAKKYDFDYWDGDRRICYGGYKYIQGRWDKVIESMIRHYNLPSNPKILDVGCGKGYLLYDFKRAMPEAEIFGIDISSYAIKHAKPEIANSLINGTAAKLPWDDNMFDLVVSINTLHNLYVYELYQALQEIERVGKGNKYICVETYNNEEEKANLLYWQVTCESFYTPKEWLWWFNQCGYTGDYSFITFE